VQTGVSEPAPELTSQGQGRQGGAGAKRRREEEGGGGEEGLVEASGCEVNGVCKKLKKRETADFSSETILINKQDPLLCTKEIDFSLDTAVENKCAQESFLHSSDEAACNTRDLNLSLDSLEKCKLSSTQNSVSNSEVVETIILEVDADGEVTNFTEFEWLKKRGFVKAESKKPVMVDCAVQVGCQNRHTELKVWKISDTASIRVGLHGCNVTCSISNEMMVGSDSACTAVFLTRCQLGYLQHRVGMYIEQASVGSESGQLFDIDYFPDYEDGNTLVKRFTHCSEPNVQTPKGCVIVERIGIATIISTAAGCKPGHAHDRVQHVNTTEILLSFEELKALGSVIHEVYEFMHNLASIFAYVSTSTRPLKMSDCPTKALDSGHFEFLNEHVKLSDILPHLVNIRCLTSSHKPLGNW
jgi:hypothetical protein